MVDGGGVILARISFHDGRLYTSTVLFLPVGLYSIPYTGGSTVGMESRNVIIIRHFISLATIVVQSIKNTLFSIELAFRA